MCLLVTNKIISSCYLTCTQYIEELQWILERKFQKICLVTRVPGKVLLLVRVQLIILHKKLKLPPTLQGKQDEYQYQISYACQVILKFFWQSQMQQSQILAQLVILVMIMVLDHPTNLVHRIKMILTIGMRSTKADFNWKSLLEVPLAKMELYLCNV